MNETSVIHHDQHNANTTRRFGCALPSYPNVTKEKNMCINSKIGELNGFVKSDRKTHNKARKMCLGIAKYLILKDMFENDNINEGFMNLFYDFYGLTRQEKSINREMIKKMLKTNKKRKRGKDYLKNILDAISKDKKQFSYATKVLHTLNDNLPIYDSRVARFVGLWSKRDDTYETLCEFYDKNDLNKLASTYEKIVKSKACQGFISYGNNDFTPKQASDISEVKKIDFMIWAFWPDNKKGKKHPKQKNT